LNSGTKSAIAGVAALAAATLLATPSSSAVAAGHAQIQHVLLISVDGMHQSDLEWYAAQHPGSELARLATGGAEYTGAQTPDPSDSDPGGTALMTGGDPKVTGIYYDDEYSHGVFPPGTTKCSGPVPGGDVIYDSPDDKLPAVPDLLHNGSGNTFPSFDEGGSIIAGVNAAWAKQHPKNPALVVQEADDGLLWWLSDRSQAATDFVKNYLWTHTAPAVNYAGQTITVQHSGLREIFAGHQSAHFFGVPFSDPHHPDVFGISQVGTIYTTGSKIAEHGGDNPGDRDVPLVVYAPGTVRSAAAAVASSAKSPPHRPASCRPTGSPATGTGSETAGWPDRL
jgi:hypothetical protein